MPVPIPNKDYKPGDILHVRVRKDADKHCPQDIAPITTEQKRYMGKEMDVVYEDLWPVPWKTVGSHSLLWRPEELEMLSEYNNEEALDGD